MGVPKPIEFWVDSLSSLIRDGLLMMVSSDNTSEYFDGDDVQEKVTSLGWNTSDCIALFNGLAPKLTS